MRDAVESAPWNAQIPEDWERRSLKYCARMKGRLGWQNLRADEYTDEGPFLVTSEHFKDDRVEWSRCYHVTEERYAMAPEIQLRNQDVFFMKDGAAMGKLAYVDRLPGPACLNSHLLLFRPKRGEFTTRFLYYVLRSPLFQEFIATEATGTTFLGISQESVGTFPLPLPPLSTQQAIVAFLDQETGRVDRLVAKKRELIDRLKEKRTALISRTVTRSLPAEALAKTGIPINPPLKPSGLTSIAEIPTSWTVSKVWLERVACNIEYQDGNHGELHPKAEDYVDDGIPFVMANHLVGGRIDFENCNYIEPELASSLRIGFARAGDVLLTHKGTIGRVGQVQASRFPFVMLTPQVTYYRCLRNIAPRYLFWFFQGKLWQDQMYLVSSLGTTRGYVGLLDQRFLNLLRPPLPEQAAIAAYLDEETAKLDALVGKVKEAVERLQEYRTALITAAVTGKIDVRSTRR